MIYTKKGDDGTTSLIGGERVMKCDLRVEAYGTIDELNSLVGLLYQKTGEAFLAIVQKNLFRVGGELADERRETRDERREREEVKSLEKEIDRLSALLPPVKDFIMPTGTEATCVAHICRTVCRRAERRIVTLDGDHPTVAYINRLSDYFFVLARVLNM